MKQMLLLLAPFFLGLFAPSLALAEEGVVVEAFGGPSAAIVRAQVVRAIDRSPSLEVVDGGGSAIVTGRVVRAGRRWRARVTAHRSDGTEIASRGFRARRVGALTGMVESWARSDLVAALSG